MINQKRKAEELYKQKHPWYADRIYLLNVSENQKFMMINIHIILLLYPLPLRIFSIMAYYSPMCI